jgi:hypothetical protein
LPGQFSRRTKARGRRIDKRDERGRPSREVCKRLFDVNAKLMVKKRAARVLAAKLRANGLKLLPALLEDFAVGDVQDMVEKIHDVAKLVESGSQAQEISEDMLAQHGQGRQEKMICQPSAVKQGY